MKELSNAADDSFQQTAMNVVGAIFNDSSLRENIIELISLLFIEALEDSQTRNSLKDRVLIRFPNLLDQSETTQGPAREDILGNTSEGRIKISTKRAATILGYHPKYFARKATDWGLTKIYMSSRSCRYYLDEIEHLAESNALTTE